MKSGFLLLVAALLMSFSARLFGQTNANGSTTESAEAVVQRQLEAYNARNLDAFLSTYADDIELYAFPNQLMSKGKERMQATYGSYFQNNPKLHCDIKKRIVQGNTVIDQEYVTGVGDKPLEAVAVYEVENGKIKKVYFVR